MNARRAIGGWLVRLGRRIARPTITVEPLRFHDDMDMRSFIGSLQRQSQEYARQTRLQWRGKDGSNWNIGAGGGGGGIYLPPDDGPTPVSC